MKKIIIIANSKKDIFSLGDYLRIVSILPNFKTKFIYWFCDKKIRNLIKYSEHIKKIYPIKKFNYKNFNKKNNLIINLFKIKNLKPNEYSVPNMINKDIDIKFSGINLCKKITSNLGIKKYKIYSNKIIRNKNKYDLFINYLAPKKWKKKEYPIKNLNYIEKKLKKKFHNIKICKQMKSDNLDQYIKKIYSSELILSIIGLGVHIGMLFNKKIIVLSGPTFFNELKKYKKGKIIFPEGSNKWKKNLEMKNINKEKILNSIIIKLKKSIKISHDIKKTKI